MSDPIQPQPVRPGLYRRPMSLWWWLHSRGYFTFMVRELTCVFVGWFAVLSIWQVRALGQGPSAYETFIERLRTPGFALLNAVALLFVVYHAITWFNLVPTTAVIRVGEQRVPDWIISGVSYLAWVVLSVVVAWVLLRQ